MLPPSGDPWAAQAVTANAENAGLAREGAAVFASCASCHLADGGGRPDGAIPRLAGQSAAILQAKLTKIRSGEVFLPVMAAFANSLAPGEVTAVATYLSLLSAPAHIGYGDGNALLVGERTYAESCAACHGAKGEGNPALEAPKLCGQHAGYIVRRVAEVRANNRGDANPGMAAIVGNLAEDQLAAVADYLSRGKCQPLPEKRP
jgi:cytochrome c553